jgi:hypothetical protein
MEKVSDEQYEVSTFDLEGPESSFGTS